MNQEVLLRGHLFMTIFHKQNHKEEVDITEKDCFHALIELFKVSLIILTVGRIHLIYYFYFQ